MTLDILVVDDDMPLLRVLALHFETQGHDVRIAPGGPEALAQVELRRPDVMVVDAMMPEMSGMEVIRRVRGSGEPQPRIIMLTANERVEASAVEAGADTFMTKPFSLQELTAQVRLLAPEIPASG